MHHAHSVESLAELVGVDPARMRQLADRFARFHQEYDPDRGTVDDAGRELLLAWYTTDTFAYVPR